MCINLTEWNHVGSSALFSIELTHIFLVINKFSLWNRPAISRHNSIWWLLHFLWLSLLQEHFLFIPYSILRGGMLFVLCVRKNVRAGGHSISVQTYLLCVQEEAFKEMLKLLPVNFSAYNKTSRLYVLPKWK
jgi:hypothetical protein